MTNSTIKKVCVYSSSSKFLPEIYYQAARELGALMGQAGFDLVYGGGSVGTMYENARAVQDFGGKVIGIIPEKLHGLGVGNEECDELIITPDMRSRKEKLDVLADAMIALAGGFGTLEEVSEMIVQKQLGYNDKAVVFLNTNGFYNNLMKFFEDIIGQNFANDEMRNLYFVANTPKEAVEYLKTYVPIHSDPTKKWAAKR